MRNALIKRVVGYGSQVDSKSTGEGSIPSLRANWLFGVTDSTKHYGCFSKGSNPLGATIV